ncbi:unnamed protein product [Psylliodes chrysocephalus]|uniref:Regulatory protein zeste n=1 Tax=Psylliodes chrysocephalus TaxID=3402493 RepID=A0A9P0CUR0_9CUCU|nr:unnamed protein product [Psylliodes chrysocephala]
MPGAKKDWRQWQKCWHDMKSKTKGKLSKIKSQMGQTGGGEPPEQVLSAWEDSLLNIIRPTVCEGHNSCMESVIEVESQEHVENVNDHDYVVNKETERNDPVDTTEMSDSENLPPQTSVQRSSKNKTPLGRRQEVKQSTEATINLTNVTKKRNVIISNYYTQKINLLREKK